MFVCPVATELNGVLSPIFMYFFKHYVFSGLLIIRLYVLNHHWLKKKNLVPQPKYLY